MKISHTMHAFLSRIGEGAAYVNDDPARTVKAALDRGWITTRADGPKRSHWRRIQGHGGLEWKTTWYQPIRATLTPEGRRVLKTAEVGR